MAKKEPKLIVEMLKFDDEKKEDKEVNVKEQPFVLKEVEILSINTPRMTFLLRWFWENRHHTLRGRW